MSGSWSPSGGPTSGDDTFVALGGNDLIIGDTINGGAGHDTLFGNTGGDTILGGHGSSRLVGNLSDRRATRRLHATPSSGDHQTKAEGFHCGGIAMLAAQCPFGRKLRVAASAAVTGPRVLRPCVAAAAVARPESRARHAGEGVRDPVPRLRASRDQARPRTRPHAAACQSDRWWAKRPAAAPSVTTMVPAARRGRPSR